MLISCPACAARYRVDPARITGQRVSIRCPGCRCVFSPSPGAVAAKAVSRILLASANVDLAQTFMARCDQAGLAGRVCSDGIEAVNALEASPADVVLLDAALTGRYAFDVIDVIRGLPGGEKVRILLLSSSFRRGSFVAKGTDLHGADASVDGADLCAMDAMAFRAFLLSGGQGAEQGELSPEVETRPGLAPDQWNQAVELAKVIAADIILRYQDLLEESARTGRLGKALVEGLTQGRKLFSDRVGVEIAADYDFFGAALAAGLYAQGHNPAAEADFPEGGDGTTC